MTKAFINTPRYDIFVTTREGDTFKAFTWRGDADAGCERAKAEGRIIFGMDIVDAYPVLA